METRKLPKSYIWRSLLCIALGLILIIWPEFTARYIITIIGTVALTVGVILAIGYYSSAKEKRYGLRFPLGALICIIVGVLLIAMPGTFAAILMVVLGLLLVLAAADQIWMLVQASRAGVGVPWWLYIFPALILITGIIIAASPISSMKTMLVLFGAAALVYGIADLMDQGLIRRGK